MIKNVKNNESFISFYFKFIDTISLSLDPIKKRQNDQHNIQQELLEKGTKVFVKGPKLQNKLEARYQDPIP